MIDAFLQYYDRITNFSAKGYEESEILLFLNNAQDEFVKERVFGKNFQPPAFDDNEKRVADIRPLIQSAPISTAVSGIYGNSIRTDPYNSDPRFIYLVSMDVQLSRTNPTITQKYIPCREISIIDAGRFRATEFNKLWFKKPVYFGTRDDGIHIIGDYYTSFYDYARVNYVSQPWAITASSQEFDGTYADTWMSLEPQTHQEIVDIAVRHAMQSQQDPRWQTQIGEQKIKTE